MTDRQLSLFALGIGGAVEIDDPELRALVPTETALARGEAAGFGGEPRTMCPFLTGVRKRDWLRGWNRGREFRRTYLEVRAAKDGEPSSSPSPTDMLIGGGSFIRARRRYRPRGRLA